MQANKLSISNFMFPINKKYEVNVWFMKQILKKLPANFMLPKKS